MARKVFQNEDLIRQIYSYGDSDHRVQMWYIFQQSKDVILTHVPATYPYSRDDAYLKDSLIEFFRLRRCNCCSRHSHNKPNILFGYTPGCRDEDVWLLFDHRTNSVPECKDLGDCNCECRHTMRNMSEWICHRSHMKTIKYESLFI